MLRKSFVLLVVGTVMFFLCSNSSADVPHMINYQGKLTTASGGCLNDTVQMTFSIYPDTLGSPADWTETQTEVVVKDGIFNVLLGSVNPISASVFDGSIKYLGVQVESDPEMSPLKPMVTASYAFRSQEADTADYARAADGIRFGKKYSYAADINPIATCYSGYVWWDYSAKELKVTETNAYNNHCHAAGYRDQGAVKDFYDVWITSGATVTVATFTVNGNWATFEITSEGSDAGYIHIHCYYSNGRLVAHYWYRYQ